MTAVKAFWLLDRMFVLSPWKAHEDLIPEKRSPAGRVFFSEIRPAFAVSGKKTTSARAMMAKSAFAKTGSEMKEKFVND